MLFEQKVSFCFDENIDLAMEHLDQELEATMLKIDESLKEDYRKNFDPLFQKLSTKYRDGFKEIRDYVAADLKNIVISEARRNSLIIAKDLNNIDLGLPYRVNTYTKKYLGRRTLDVEYNQKNKVVIVKVSYKHFKHVFANKVNDFTHDKQNFYILNSKLKIDNAYREYIKLKKQYMQEARESVDANMHDVSVETFESPQTAVNDLPMSDEAKRLEDGIELLMQDLASTTTPSVDEMFDMTTPLDKIEKLINELESLDDYTDIEISVDENLNTIDINDVSEPASMDVDELIQHEINQETSEINQAEKEAMVNMLTGELDDSQVEHTELHNIEVEVEKAPKTLGKKFLITLLETLLLVIIMLIATYIYMQFFQN